MLYELVANSARRAPSSLAIESPTASLTYAELDALANRLARALVDMGVKPGERVAIWTEKSPRAVAAMQGALRAGAAYVPVDPLSPASRAKLILDDCGVRVAVTDARRADELSTSAFGNMGIVSLSDPPASGLAWSDVLAYSEAPVEVPPRAEDNLAYILYTSGSTGKPKGVCISHRNAMSFIEWAADEIRANEADRFSNHAPFHFDLSVLDLYVAFRSGGSVHLIPEQAAYVADALVEFVHNTRPTIWYSVPTAISLMMRHGLGEIEPLPIRALLFAGEPFPIEPLKQLRARWPDIRLLNLYGPTETNVCTFYEVPSSLEGRDRPVPIGRECSGNRAWAVKQTGQPAEVREQGELIIDGPTVMIGYWGGDRQLRKPYHTGDIVEVLEDGSFEYVGRRDQMLKVRGHRVEPGEIETVLTHHDAIEEACVVGYGRPNTELVAWLVATTSEAPDLMAVKRHCAARLPWYMVVHRVRYLDELPRTRNGKVNRKALEEMCEAVYLEGRGRGTAGSSELGLGVTEHALLGGNAGGGRRLAQRLGSLSDSERETAVLEFLREEVARILRLPDARDVAPDRPLLQLGFDSLLLTELGNQIRSAVGIGVSLQRLFSRSSLVGLAEEIAVATPHPPGPEEGPRTRSPEPGDSTTSPLVAVRQEESPALSYAQQRMWVWQQLNPDSSAYNQPLSIRLRGPLDTEALRSALEEVVWRHEALRTVFPAPDGEPYQEVWPAPGWELPIEDLTTMPDASPEVALQQRGTEELTRPFDLEAAPPLRTRLLRIAEEDHVFLATMHHIVVDGWSLRVLWSELAALYRAHLRGEEARLPELPVQYIDYAAWQRAWLDGALLDRQLGYWRERLAGAPEEVALPLKGRRPRVQTFRGDEVWIELEREQLERLRAFGQRENTTLFMTLLAGFRALLFRYTSQEDICIGTPVAGRTRREIEHLIGFFVNTLVLRTEARRDQTFSDLLAREKDTALQAYDYQDAPFDLVVGALDIERSPSRPPLVQVMFAHQGDIDDFLSRGLEGVTGEALGSFAPAASFDLVVETWERRGRLAVSFTYNTDLFERSLIEQMALHYQRLLHEVVLDPLRQLRNIPLLDHGDRQQMPYRRGTADASRDAT